MSAYGCRAPRKKWQENGGLLLDRMRGDGQRDSSRWHGWRVAVLNPVWLGISYCVHWLGRRSKGGQEGELGSNAIGKYVYELILTSHALVESLAL